MRPRELLPVWDFILCLQRSRSSHVPMASIHQSCCRHPPGMQLPIFHCGGPVTLSFSDVQAALSLVATFTLPTTDCWTGHQPSRQRSSAVRRFQRIPGRRFIACGRSIESEQRGRAHQSARSNSLSARAIDPHHCSETTYGQQLLAAQSGSFTTVPRLWHLLTCRMVVRGRSIDGILFSNRNPPKSCCGG